MSRVLIVGGGVIGLCTAFYARQQGHEITILERASAEHEGCSFGNAGMIVPSHFIPLAAPGMVRLGLKWMWNPESPFYIKPRLDSELMAWGYKFWRAATREHVARSAPLLRDLHLGSRACFEELAEVTSNDFGLVKRGLLMLCKTAHALEEEGAAAETARGLGIPAEVLDAKQAAALDPAIRMDIQGAIYFPKDCHLAPAQFMASLRKQLERGAVQFHYGAAVLEWITDNRAIAGVRTDHGEFKADEYVIAAGSWSPGVTKALGLSIPMQAGKGYSLTLKNPPQLPGICSILTEARVAVTPMGKSLRVGGTMEIAGLNEEINPRRVRGIIKSAVQYYPEFEPRHFEGIQPWCGLRPCSPDGLPYLGRAKTFSNLSIATGHSMMGLSLGPITGKLMGEILSGKKPSISIQLLDPNRYA